MKNTKIQWTQCTWNPHHGCRKVDTECRYCYMYRDKDRHGQDPKIVLKSKTKFDEPLKWKEPTLIFTCSWSDWFIEEADQWRDELWAIIKATPHHTYQILTKRPERILQCLPADWGEGYDNVWLGVSVGTNKGLSRCEILAKIPAKIKFISAEPLLEDLTGLNEILAQHKFDWCIIGGESGNKTGKHLFRECKLEWIKNIISACQIHEVKIFIKQLGTFLKNELHLEEKHGGNIDEWPVELQIREYPKYYKQNKNQPMKTNEIIEIDETYSKKTIKRKHKPLVITVNGKLIPEQFAKTLMPLLEFFLEKKHSNELPDGNVKKSPEPSMRLSPFKQIIADALLSGETPDSLATRLAVERNMPRPTAQAYVTMVLKYQGKK